ncbi:MAG: peptigoglycan-binding protein LysM [Alphaproteobacteria bacterium]|nr:peptigoglycan-binding protein LysM [Alphaproteobacteria bacterium]
MFSKPPQPIVALPEPADTTQKDARVPAAETPADTAPETPAEAAAPAAEEPKVTAPSFDVVRVEGDGSIVIAGRTVPGSKVEILVGSKVIGSDTAGPEGDFAAVLGEPLKPGDYQIVLRSTTPDNVVAMSVETAVVSVPETADGQVLALVEKPGKPSELIIKPEPTAPATEAAPASPPAEAPAADAAPATTPGAETPVAEAPAVEAPAAAPETGGEQQAALQPEAEQPAAPSAPAAAPAGTEVAGPHVFVEAVEIDGRKVFVAGAADPGRRVRGYANEILLGDATASPDGRFLIETERDLPVGDYIIRVDALEPDGVKVAARAAVPFEREPGESIAAIAPAAPPVAAPTAPAASRIRRSPRSASASWRSRPGCLPV